MRDGPLNSLDLPGRPADTRVVVAMSGGVDSSVVAGLLAERGLRRGRRHAAALRPRRGRGRKGSCCAGQDIHDARRVAETLGIPHYVSTTSSASARPSSTPSPTATSPARPRCPASLQPDGQVRRPARDRAGSRRRRARHRPLHPPPRLRPRRPPRAAARSTPTATRATSCSPPRRRSSTICAFRSAACPRPRPVRAAAERMGLPSPTSRQPGHLLRAAGQVHRHHRQAAPGPPTPGDIVHIDGRVLGRTRASSATPSASAAASASPVASRSTSSTSIRRTPA
jgi:tRNA-uridine 2-sulfurtransferase